MSLDQLESFLQESDEKDYLPDVDDQEEYQKFLAAVLEEGAAPVDDKAEQHSIPEDDEDDDDADFEAEIEEALENDREARNAVRRRQRIETRGRHRQKPRAGKKTRVPCVGTGQLRPLVPCVGGLTAVKCSSSRANGYTETGDSRDTRKEVPVSGFTAHQIGQLHSLIHEHVQLLVQVFALCILEPTRQQIAIDTHMMLIEIADKRDAILSWKETAFPDFCFRLPYIHPSVTEDFPCHASSASYDAAVGRLQGDLENMQHYDKPCSTASTCAAPISADSWCFTENGAKISRQIASEYSASHSDTLWEPLISGPVRSLLDVAPLSKMREFLADMSKVVQHYRQRHLETGMYHSQCEREPLFGMSKQSQLQEDSGLTSRDGCVVLSPSQHGKKSMASTLVESAKKQCTALVPKGVVKSMQVFLPHFNSALFPHKAPPPATTSRLLFTDSEDELLAMGLMTYNTDWKAIQQRFLPSKTMHQIFVRQKNRSSARAPENSIKAVKRLKLSALTPIERESIRKDSTGSTGNASCPLDYDRLLAHDTSLEDWKPFSLRPTDAAASVPNNYDHSRTRIRKRKMRGQMLEQGNARSLQMKALGMFHQPPQISFVPPLPSYPGGCLHEPEPNLEDGCHIHRPLSIRAVKLSPDLPSLNLPPNVLVLSQSIVDHPEGLINSNRHSNECSGDLPICQNQLSLQTLAAPSLGQIDESRLDPQSHSFAGGEGGTSSPKSSFNTNVTLVPKNDTTLVNNHLTPLNNEARPLDAICLRRANAYHPKHNQMMVTDTSLSTRKVCTRVCLSAGTSEQTVSHPSLHHQVARKFHPFYSAPSASTTNLGASP